MRILLYFLALVFSGVANAAAPVATATPSDTSGVAPHCVVWDATGDQDSDTTRDFHDLIFTWDFGDTSAGTWTYGARDGQSKNAATGGVAGHCYETVGSYGWTLKVSDGSNVDDTTGTITVTDPDTVFTGTATVCIANSTATAGAGGCPSGASTPAGTSDFDVALAACIGTTKRCLFKRGDTFAASTTTTISTAGPAIIGAYGTGADPAITSTNITVITISVGATDLRVMDLNIAGSGAADTGTAISVTGATTGISFLGLTIANIGSGIILQTGGSITGGVLYENNIAVKAVNAVYGHFIQSAIIGNVVGPNAVESEHLLRIQPGQKLAITNNTLDSPGYKSTTARNNLTIRALVHATGSSDDPDNDSYFVYISDNKILGGTTGRQLFQIEPANNGDNHWIYDTVVERNHIIHGANGIDGLYGHSSRMTVRNNICNASGASVFRYCFKSTASSTNVNVPEPTGNKFLNNTCYASDASTSFDCVYLDGGTGSIIDPVIKNNLAYASLATTGRLLGTAGTITNATGASGTEGNSSDVQVEGTNPFGTTPTSEPVTFAPATAEYADNGGVAAFPATGLFADFFRCHHKTAATYQIGAIVDRANAICTGRPEVSQFDPPAWFVDVEPANDPFWRVAVGQ